VPACGFLSNRAWKGRRDPEEHAMCTHGLEEYACIHICISVDTCRVQTKTPRDRLLHTPLTRRRHREQAASTPKISSKQQQQKKHAYTHAYFYIRMQYNFLFVGAHDKAGQRDCRTITWCSAAIGLTPFQM
jgi:hypothetical protein